MPRRTKRPEAVTGRDVPGRAPRMAPDRSECDDAPRDPGRELVTGRPLVLGRWYPVSGRPEEVKGRIAGLAPPWKQCDNKVGAECLWGVPI